MDEKISRFYLQLDGAVTSDEVLECIGKYYLMVKGCEHTLLIAELKQEYTIRWIDGKTETNIIAISGNKDSVKDINNIFPIVNVLILKTGKLDSILPKDISEFTHICKGIILKKTN